jgi:hypothetical protein
MANEDLEVTSVLDPDMTGKDVELTGQDIDFELDDSLLEDGPDEDFLDLADLDALNDEDLAPPAEAASSPASPMDPESPMDPASPMDDDDIDFELGEPIRETAPSDDDIDFELDAPIAEAATGTEPDMEEVDFDLDQIIADTDEGVPEPMEVAEDELEEPVDFELEEVVESAPQPEPELEAEAAPAVDTGMPDVPEYTPPPAAPVEAVASEPASIEFDVERIEAMVEKTVRETVTQVLERMLPGLVEEALTRIFYPPTKRATELQMALDNLDKAYSPAEVERRWYRFWEDNKLFHADENKDGDHFSIVIPPPNVTGNLHMGHALNNTMQDILIRYHRMKGHNTLWVPGMDHAGIATQNVVERQMAEEGTLPVTPWAAKIHGAGLGMAKENGGKISTSSSAWVPPATGTVSASPWMRV